jgi:hypothetical protein
VGQEQYVQRLILVYLGDVRHILRPRNCPKNLNVDVKDLPKTFDD